MNALQTAIKEAIEANGDNKKANDKAYLEFIKNNYIIPIEKDSTEQEPKVLYFEEKGQAFLPAFDDMNYFDNWALDIQDEIQLLKVSGVDLLKNIGDHVVVCYNIASPFYKEFHPQEIARMKGIVLKFFKN